MSARSFRRVDGADIFAMLYRELAVLTAWLDRLGEEAPAVDAGLRRRALLEAYGAGWRLALYFHEVEDPAPPLPPAERRT